MIPSKWVRITDPRLRHPETEFFTSLEGENPGGSIKDHMVEGELRELFENSRLRTNGIVCEISAGSTAQSLAFWVPRFGGRCELYLPNSLPEDLRKRLQDLGASLHFRDPSEALGLHESLSRDAGLHYFNQLGDPHKRRHYVSLGRRLRPQVGPIDLVVGAVGTGHSLSGLAEGLGAAGLWTAEPEPPLQIPGIRHLDFENWGPYEPCAPENFTRRLFVKPSDPFWKRGLLTDSGEISTPPSFQIVLNAVSNLPEPLPKRVWLISAASTGY